MLKGIPTILSPELLKILMEMGHGDEIILADGNFPAQSMGQRVIRCDGHEIPELLEAVLKFLPLDTYVDFPVSLMSIVPGDQYNPEIWQAYTDVLLKSGNMLSFNFLERFEFYERSKKAYAIVATGEKALYANIILKKGVV